MKLPVIKSITEFIAANDEDYVHEAVELLEHLTDSDTLKDEELEVVAELISNMLGAIDVAREIRNGADKKAALNGFMKRVLGSIDK